MHFVDFFWWVFFYKYQCNYNLFAGMSLGKQEFLCCYLSQFYYFYQYLNTLKGSYDIPFWTVFCSIFIVEVGGTFPKIRINLSRAYIVKENHILSGVSEILWYKHTQRLRTCYFYLMMGLCIFFFYILGPTGSC